MKSSTAATMAAFRPAWETGGSSASGSGAGWTMMVGWAGVGSTRMGAGTTVTAGDGGGAITGAGSGALAGAGASSRFTSMCCSSQRRLAPQRTQCRLRVALGMPQLQSQSPCWARK